MDSVSKHTVDLELIDKLSKAAKTFLKSHQLKDVQVSDTHPNHPLHICQLHFLDPITSQRYEMLVTREKDLTYLLPNVVTAIQTHRVDQKRFKK